MREDRYQQAFKEPISKVMYCNFVGGVSWGVGTVVGLTLFLALLGGLINFTRNVPFLDTVTEVVINEINENRRTVNEEFDTRNLENDRTGTTSSDSFAETEQE